ncbi:MAG TPA: alpha/beta hydrolase [Gemmatimonadaceae bacterium]|nr:alpha/beta hydrolase [Gemmatimonadaceae bacterium]
MTPPRHQRAIARKKTEAVLAEHARSFALVVRDATNRIATYTIGDGPAVMLLHGWGGAATDLMPLGGAFARAGYRAVLFDMPGHGRSSGRESSLVEFLRATRVVASALGAPELIVGHSFGGAAATFAITELGLPARGAVLIAPAPGPGYYVERFTRAVGLPAARVAGMVRRLVQRVGRPIESLDATVAARDADVPALIIHDPNDREVPWRYASAMADAWRSSRLVPAPSLGHRRILRDPSTIAAAIDFASSLA